MRRPLVSPIKRLAVSPIKRLAQQSRSAAAIAAKLRFVLTFLTNAA